MSTTQLLQRLDAIATGTMWLATLWHAVLAVALLAFLRGWRPSSRVAGVLLATPIASVAIVGAIWGSWFNAIVFGGLAIALVAYARRLPPAAICRAADWQVMAGHAFIGFGAFYPHFIEGQGPLAYLVATPLGTLPCPTLSLVIGFTLLAGGFSRAWNLTLVFLAVFYGAIGMVQLGVWIDLGLVLAGLTLAWLAANEQDMRPAARTLHRR